MKRLRKTSQLPIRFTPDQLKLAERAADVLSKRTGEIVTPTEVIRDGGMRYVNEILDPAQTPVVAQ